MKKLLLIVSYMLLGLNAFAGQSVDIASDILEIERIKGKATFKGNVKAVYQDLVLTAENLIIIYDEKVKTEDKIKSVIAVKDVKLVQGDDVVTSQYAEYEVVKNNIVFKQDVTLNRAGNTLQGEHLIIDTITKDSKMLAGKDRRVKVMYYQEDKPKQAK